MAVDASAWSDGLQGAEIMRVGYLRAPNETVMQNRPNEVFARHGIEGVLNLDVAEAEMDVDNIPRIAIATPDGRIVGVGVAQAILIAVELAKDYPNEADRLKLLIEVARRL